MKNLRLTVLSLAALVFARPPGLCTLNADEPSIEERLAALEAENAEMKRQLALPSVLDPAPPDGTLAMLCRGAGVELDDVRWRIQSGLDADQAVQAALAQKQHDEGGDPPPAEESAGRRRRAKTQAGSAALALLAALALVFAALAGLAPVVGVKAAAVGLAALSLLGLGRARWSTVNAETAAGTRKVLNLRADAAHAYTHLLVRAGSDAFHGAVCGAANRPIGSTTDSPDAAEDIFAVDPLNRTDASRRLRCATALVADIDVYTAAGGFVQAEPTSAGTYWLVGRTAALAVQESAGNYVVEVVTQPPVRLTVAATPSTVGNIAAAMAAPGLVKFL